MTERSAKFRGFRQPAEWDTHEACWLAWPSHGELWEEDLPAAREEFTALCRAISGIDHPGPAPAERLEVLVPDEANERLAAQALRGLPVRFHRIAFGDIWLRDTGPIFLRNEQGELAVSRFAFNGWGGKYVLPHDADVSKAIAGVVKLPDYPHPWILEGGSVEVDGEGTCLTTRQCLLNPNRNAGMSRDEIERGLGEALGVQTVLWLGDGLLNDHTDGHIDTIARYIRPGVVMVMSPANADDPNRDVLEKIASDLSEMRDARGRRLQVARIPSPGRVLDEEGEIMPASHLNFYIGNRTVVVPTYGTATARAAVEAVATWFPGRKTIGLPAKAILSGGGAFHCITQQQPEGGSLR